MPGTASGVIFSKNGRDIDIEIYQGKSISFSIIYGGADDPINVTGYDARMQVRKKRNKDSVLIADFSPEEGRVSIGGSNGLITFTMDADDSADLEPGSYVYDVEIISGAGFVVQPFSGRCTIIGECTA